jgi:hypothetical protein
MGICVDVPTAWEITERSPTGVTWFRKGEGGIFTVHFEAGGQLPADIESTIGKTPGKPAEQGVLYGGKGKWVLGDRVTNVYVQSSKGVASCGGSSDAKGTRDLLELCKKIAPM